jgi:hypothetical protein
MEHWLSSIRESKQSLDALLDRIETLKLLEDSEMEANREDLTKYLVIRLSSFLDSSFQNLLLLYRDQLNQNPKDIEQFKKIIERRSNQDFHSIRDNLNYYALPTLAGFDRCWADQIRRILTDTNQRSNKSSEFSESRETEKELIDSESQHKGNLTRLVTIRNKIAHSSPDPVSLKEVKAFFHSVILMVDVLHQAFSFTTKPTKEE